MSKSQAAATTSARLHCETRRVKWCTWWEIPRACGYCDYLARTLLRRWQTVRLYMEAMVRLARKHEQTGEAFVLSECPSFGRIFLAAANRYRLFAESSDNLMDATVKAFYEKIGNIGPDARKRLNQAEKKRFIENGNGKRCVVMRRQFPDLVAKARRTHRGADLRAIPALYLGMYAGLRISDCVRVRFGDLSGDWLKVYDPKGGWAYTVPAPPQLQDYLVDLRERRRATEGDYVVTGKIACGKPVTVSSVHRDLHALGITQHALRRGYAIFLDDKGVPVAAIAEVLNHRDARTTMRYLRRPQEELKAVIVKAFTDGE